MSTAIIGLGNIGSRLARNLTSGGEKVIIADRTLAKAETLAAELGDNAQALSIPEAISDADVVILTVWFEIEKQVIAEYSEALSGKIIVDPSNPIAPDGAGGFRKIIGEQESSGEIIASLLPKDARLVKAFGTLSAEALGAETNRKPERAVLFYAADDSAAGDKVASLIDASGYTPLSIGGIDQSIRIEVGGDLHQLGGLGELVTLSEAQAKI